MKKVVAYPKNDIILRPPAFPTERAQVLRRLKSAVDAAECRDGGKLELQQFAELLGMPASTNHDWYYGQLPAAIRRFICGIERLSAPARSAFLDQVCRECPRLSHPRLAGNLIVLESAKALMEQPSGLVCILGSVEEVRRFVMTAMGNSTIPLGVTRRIAGIDLHQPELLVPIPGLLYFRKGVSLTQAKAQVKLLWKEIECSSAEIIMLNGLWDLFPELRNRIVALSDERNVILADAFKSGLPERQGKIIKTVATEMALPPSQAIRLLMGEK